MMNLGLSLGRGLVTEVVRIAVGHVRRVQPGGIQHEGIEGAGMRIAIAWKGKRKTRKLVRPNSRGKYFCL